MGIPSYFSYIIRNYPRMVKNLRQHSNTDFHHLFMDCNSIIYDSYHLLSKQPEYSTRQVFENILIQDVIQKIEHYILLIKPKKTIYIAFDGVAPFAKMNQQKTRRYKSEFMAKQTFIKPSTEQTIGINWSTANITPGTIFMNNLSKKIQQAFHGTRKYGFQNVIVTGSDEAGEGEHKIFQYLRQNPCPTENMILYGLDADLFMLSIFHSHLFQNGYVFREAPEFLKSSIQLEVNKDTDKEEPYVLDMKVLCESILNEINCLYPHQQRIYDYVFMCFLLGNDFLPHFPALNIRTHGIPVLLDIYADTLGKRRDCFFIDTNTRDINWSNFALFIKALAKSEYEFLLQEYVVRDKLEKRHYKTNTPEEREQVLLNIPTIYRKEEHYIYPREKMWEDRYYMALFEKERTPDNVKAICDNYLEAIEWVYRYYSMDCPDWRWSYNYHYPPLLTDLSFAIPHDSKKYMEPNTQNSAFSPEFQLAYVLPSSQMDLLPEKTKMVLEKYPEICKKDYEFKWAFCRYFWEAHVVYPDFSKEFLEKIEKDL